MSKKKSFSGSTMTLKDFHGGSIPSDLPLPSAPGMSDHRTGHDRHNSGAWTSPGPLGRGYGGERGGFVRQGNVVGVRQYEDKVSYFPNPANIGRNYDEDERRPVDDHLRRPHNAESYEDHTYEERRGGHERPMDPYSVDNRASHGSSAYIDSRNDNYVHDELASIPVGPLPSKPLPHDLQQRLPMPSHQQDVPPFHSRPSQEQMGFYQSLQMSPGVLRSPQQHQNATSPPPSTWRQASGASSHQLGAASVGSPSGSGALNVWTARREGELGRSFPSEPVGSDLSSSWRGQAPASRVAQASAVEKVSSGRWKSRLSSAVVEQPQPQLSQTPFPSDVEFGQSRYTPDGSQELYNENTRNNYNDYIRNAYPENRSYYSDSGRGKYPEMAPPSLSEHYVEADCRTLSESNVDRADFRVRFLDSGRSNFSDHGHMMFSEEGVGHHVGKFGGRPNPGYLESAVTAGNEGGTYLEPSEVSQGNFGLRGLVAGEYEGRVSSYGDGYRIPAHGMGRRGMDNTDHRNDVDSGRSSFLLNTGGSPGHYLPDSAGEPYFEAHAPAYTYEKGPESHGFGASRDGYSSEGVKNHYTAESSKAYASERSQSSFSKQHDRGSLLYLQAPQELRGSADDEIGKAVYGSQIISDFAVKEAPMERPKLKLLPRSKQNMTPPGDTGSLQDDEYGGTNYRPWTSSIDSAVIEAPMERPKLKLTPRSKRTETMLTDSSSSQGVFHGGDLQQGAEGGQLAGILLPESTPDGPGCSTSVQSAVLKGAVNGEEANRLAERPKLVLKPRSHSASALTDFGSEKERQSVFGGARPRELVLKERGIDDSIIAGIDPVPMPGSGRPTSGGDRINVGGGEQVQLIEKLNKFGDEKPEARHYKHSESGKNRSVDRQDGSQLEWSDNHGKEDGWFDKDRKDDLRASERNENQRLQEKVEPKRQNIIKQDSWHRSAEVSNSPFGLQSPRPGLGTIDVISRTPGRHGYVSGSSAAELAEAFSRSASLSPAIGGLRGYTTQRTAFPQSPGNGSVMGHDVSGFYGVPTKELPFSRLTESPVSGARDNYSSGILSGYKQNNDI
eukprot:c29164_g1_i2 orf=441-3638(+)